MPGACGAAASLPLKKREEKADKAGRSTRDEHRTRSRFRAFQTKRCEQGALPCPSHIQPRAAITSRDCSNFGTRCLIRNPGSVQTERLRVGNKSASQALPLFLGGKSQPSPSTRTSIVKTATSAEASRSSSNGARSEATGSRFETAKSAVP